MRSAASLILCVAPALTLVACAASRTGTPGAPRVETDQRPPEAAAPWQSELDTYLVARARTDSFAGVVMVAKDGRPLYRKAFGLANRESGAPMTIDTRLTIASVTKFHTQIAIQQLIQSGRVKLSDTVGRFIPDYPNAVVRSRVTVEQLLRHRSGVGSFWNARFMASRASVRSVDDYLRLFREDSLMFEPGTKQEYSNGGYVILGAIVERVSGQSFHDYLREHVFRPAGMTETGAYDSRTSTDVAMGYTFQNLQPTPGRDQRLAGSGPRPGYETPQSGTVLRMVGPDGAPLTPEQIAAIRAARASGQATRRPNTSSRAGVSSPAGDSYSTVGDFVKLTAALTSHRLLDEANTRALLGPSFDAGEFRVNGGGPGVNAEVSVYKNGYLLVVLSNYDPPAATDVAQLTRRILPVPRR